MKMCTTRDNPGQNPFKALKPVPLEKTKVDFITTSLKAAASIILIFSATLVLYSCFRPNTRPAFFRRSEFQYPTEYITRLNSDPSPTNISHIAFGIAGSTRTWPTRFHYSDLWWKPNITRGYVFLDKKPDPNLKFKIQHRVSSDWTRFRHTSGSGASVRIARVVLDLFRVGLPNVRWFVMGDDDTVFFGDNLVAVLGRYDHRRMVYIGGNSESVEQNVMHAYDMAFGGGGFAVSYALAAELVGVMDGCLNRYHYFYGSDQRVWACIGELGVALTRESGFHQIDIRGDLFGLLSAHPMAPLVSLHHLDYVNPLFPNQTQLQSLSTLMKAYEVDPSRTLQQCICYHHKHKWSVSISWGYAVQLYSTLLPAKELEMPLQTFKTWRSRSDGPFTFNTRPMSSDPCAQPVVFYLDSVEEGANGETITTYKKSEVKPMMFCNWQHARAMGIESIVVSASKMNHQEWKEVPRRWCCEINKRLTQRTMRIKIRKCRLLETITI